MSLNKDKQQNEKGKNKYYDITEEDIENGEITTYVLNDNKTLYALRYGKEKDNMAVIALATINNIDTTLEERKSLLKSINNLKLNPNIRDIRKVKELESDYLRAGLQITDEAKEIFSQWPKKFVLNSIPKTVEYNQELGKIEKLYCDKLEAENYRNFQRLELYLKNLAKTQPKEYKKYKNGKESIFKVLTINSLSVPKNYDDAKKVQSVLNSMKEFDEKSIIENMKSDLSNDQKKDLYKEFLGVKLLFLIGEETKKLSEIKGKEKSYKTQEIKESILFDQKVYEYIYSNGKKPENDKQKEYLENLEKIEITDEALFRKEIEILLQAVDPMKTEFYNKNQEDIKIYCDEMKNFGVFYQLEPTEKVKDFKEKTNTPKREEKSKQDGFEPGD